MTPTIDPESIKANLEIWGVPDASNGTLGNGSKASPFRLGGTGIFDQTIQSMGPSLRVHLAPGVYLTKDLAVHGIIMDAPQGGVTIRLADNTAGAVNPPHIRMIRDKGWSPFFCVSNIIFDGNWSNQPGIQSGNFKIEPIAVKTLIGQVRGCTLINWGSAGHKDYYLEAFPLSLTTIATGTTEQDLAFYVPDKKPYWGKEPVTRLEILDNIVEQPHFSGGAYCTAIFVRTNMGVEQGDRQPMGTRTTQAALVRGNRVNVPGGIAYGSGGTRETPGGSKGDWGVEQTVFEDNDAVDCKCFFNDDTGRMRNVIIRNNRAFNCSQGPNITPDALGYDVEVSGNTFHFGQPFDNKIAGTIDDQWGIRSVRVTNISAKRNTFIIPAGFTGMILDGVPGNENRVIKVAAPVDSGALSDAYEKIRELNEGLEVMLEKSKSSALRETALKNLIAEARAEILKADRILAG